MEQTDIRHFCTQDCCDVLLRNIAEMWDKPKRVAVALGIQP